MSCWDCCGAKACSQVLQHLTDPPSPKPHQLVLDCVRDAERRQQSCQLEAPSLGRHGLLTEATACRKCWSDTPPRTPRLWCEPDPGEVKDRCLLHKSSGSCLAISTGKVDSFNLFAVVSCKSVVLGTVAEGWPWPELQRIHLYAASN